MLREWSHPRRTRQHLPLTPALAVRISHAFLSVSHSALNEGRLRSGAGRVLRASTATESGYPRVTTGPSFSPQAPETRRARLVWLSAYELEQVVLPD